MVPKRAPAVLASSPIWTATNPLKAVRTRREVLTGIPIRVRMTRQRGGMTKSQVNCFGKATSFLSAIKFSDMSLPKAGSPLLANHPQDTVTTRMPEIQIQRYHQGRFAFELMKVPRV